MPHFEGRRQHRTRILHQQIYACRHRAGQRGGLRHYDPTKPAVVIDAYEAYNLMADYGLADRPFYHIREDTMCELLASLFVGDMNMHRRYYYEQRYDGKTQKQKTGTV